MKREEAIKHLEFMAKGYQNLLDNDERCLEAIGKGCKRVVEVQESLADVYKAQIDALNLAIAALTEETKDCAYCVLWDNELKTCRHVNREPSGDLISIAESEKRIKPYNAEEIEYLKFAIASSTGDTDYMVGLRNGLRIALAKLDGEEPQFEDCQPKKGEWVPMSDHPPATYGCYLVTLKGGDVLTDDYFSYGWDDFGDQVIAWAPLPMGYEERKEE